MGKKTAVTPKLDADDDEKSELVAKLDALEKKFELLLAKYDAEMEKELSDEEKKKLAEKKKAEAEAKTKTDAVDAIFKKILSKSVSKEKLDAWDHDQLVMAMELKDEITPQMGNPFPNSKKEDAAAKTDAIPSWDQVDVD